MLTSSSFRLITKFFWGTSSGFFEFADKVAYIVKAAVHGDTQNGQGGVGQKAAGPLNAVVYEILDGGDAGQFFEEAAQVLGVAGDGVRQVF